MTRNELFRFAHKRWEKAVKLAESKNRDYAREGDPLWNLRRGGPYGVAVRLDDKIGRLLNLLRPGHKQAVDESLEDTLLDVMNYGWLALALLTEEKEEGDG